MKSFHIVAAVLVAFPAVAGAQTAAAAGTAASAPAAARTQGEVRKIDKAQGKVTLRHGPITNLDMPAMTMVFRVADPKLLDTLREGDKVTFTADKLDAGITLTSIEAAR
jgi:Cu/Ag efflux protein CusF